MYLNLATVVLIHVAATLGFVTHYPRKVENVCPETKKDLDEFTNASLNSTRMTSSQVCYCLTEVRKNGHVAINAACNEASIIKSQLKANGFSPVDLSLNSCPDQVLSSVYQVDDFLEKFSDYAQWSTMTVYTDIANPYSKFHTLWKKFSNSFKLVRILSAPMMSPTEFITHLERAEIKNVVLLCSFKNTLSVLQQISQHYYLCGDPFNWLIIAEVKADVLFNGLSLPFDCNIIVAPAIYFNDKKAIENFPFHANEVPMIYQNDQSMEKNSLISCYNLQTTTKIDIEVNLTVELFEGYGHPEERRVILQPIGYWSPAKQQLTTYRQFPNLFRQLGGIQLIVAALHHPPHSTIVNDSDGKLILGGIGADIIESLSAQMNFSYKIITPADNTYGMKTKSGWTGMMKLLYEKKADLTGSLSIMSSQRTDIIDYSPAVGDALFKIIYLKPIENPWNFTFFWVIFETTVWLAVVALIIFVSALLALSYHCENRIRMKKFISSSLPLMFSVFCRAAESCMHSLTQKGATLQSSATSTLLIFYVFEIFSLLIFSSYCSMITSVLTTERPKVPFNSLHELARHTEYGIVVLKGSTSGNMLRQAKRGAFAEAWKKIEQDESNSFVKSTNEGIHRIRTSKVGFIADYNTLNYELQDDVCDFQFAAETVAHFGKHVAYRKEFPFAKVLNNHIRLLKESGVIHRINKKHGLIDSNKLCTGSHESQSFTVQRIIGLFIILAMGIIIASLTTAAEWFCYKQLREDENKWNSRFKRGRVYSLHNTAEISEN